MGQFTETDVNNNLNYKEDDYWDEREKPVRHAELLERSNYGKRET